MARSDSKPVLYAIVAALALIAIGEALYIGRLRWRNAFVRADLENAQRQLAARSSAPPPASAPAPVRSANRNLSAEQRAAMLEKLTAEAGAQKDVWFTSAANDAEAIAYQRALQGVFEEAGWRVRRSAPAEFALRPGIFFMMADVAPPTYVSTALSAFQAAQIELSSGRDYRAFNERKKLEDPTWRGFEMDSDQHYIIAVGPAPQG
jgi:hypothetical protein